MARLANCPQCDHEMFVPESAVEGAWGRCPNCQAFFQLKEAPSRELATFDVVESTTGPEPSEPHAINTVADISTMATWDGGSEDDPELQVAEDVEPAALHIARDLDESESQSGDEFNFDELSSVLDDEEPAASDAEEVDGIAKAEYAAGSAELESSHEDKPVESADLHVADVEADSLHFDGTEVETPEAAAERIDAWFRSAKTLADLPPVGSVEVNYKTPSEDELTRPPTHNATVELGSGGIAELSDDFDLDMQEESSEDVPVWDDTQHIDRLLADAHDQPRDEFVPSSAADELDVDEFSDASSADEAKDAENAESQNSDWAPAESFAITPPVAPGRKRSPVRLLAATVVGGLMAVPLAGYALLWLRGPDADFAGMAKYLPKAVLPASFNPPPKQMTAAPTFTEKETPPVEPTEPPAVDPAAPTTETAKATDDAAKTPDTSEEKLASFTETAKTPTAAPPEKERYAGATAATDKPAEPAAFNAPPAAPVKDESPLKEPIRVANAPTFTTHDLSNALSAGKSAEAGLVNGNFADSIEIARTKGYSYSILADLAQKLTFVDLNSGGDVAKLGQESDELFQSALAAPHTRDEVSQIVFKWIASPKRTHGGVFFAGNVSASDAKGNVRELTIDLGGGQSLPVLLPADAPEPAKGSEPVAVVGWIVDKPAENMPGYTGSAAQAIFAPKLLPLQ